MRGQCYRAAMPGSRTGAGHAIELLQSAVRLTNMGEVQVQHPAELVGGGVELQTLPIGNSQKKQRLGALRLQTRMILQKLCGSSGVVL